MSTYENPFSDDQPMEPYNEMWAQRRKANRKLKDIALQMVTKKGSVEKFQQLEEKLDEALAVLADDKDLEGRMEWVNDGDDLGNYRVFAREITPLAGQSSPVAPPLHIWFDKEAGTSHGRVTCDWTYEGPPYCVHGGIVAALFDDFLGCSQILSGKTGATGRLTLHYHRPTPLNKELKLQGRVESVKGRKINVVGEMYADDKLTVSAEGLFVTIEEGVMNLSEHKQTGK